MVHLTERPRAMLVDDKHDNRPPPDYSELPEHHQKGDDWGATSASAHARSRSVLYDDMNDPFSNSAAVASTSSVRVVDGDDGGYFGKQNTLSAGVSPPKGMSTGADGPTTLRAVSPHSFEYVAPEDIPDDTSLGERRPSSRAGAAAGGALTSTTGPRGPRPPSKDGRPRNSFYDLGLYDGTQRSPTNSISDDMPLVDRSGTRGLSSLSRNSLGGEADRQYPQHRGMQPLGADWSI